MRVTEYREKIDALEYDVLSLMSCVNDYEKKNELPRLIKSLEELKKAECKRASERDIIKKNSLIKQAEKICTSNGYLIETENVSQ